MLFLVLLLLSFLSLVGVSLYKVNTIENDSIPEVLDEIDNNKKNTTAIANSLTGKINDFEGKTSEELASIINNQKKNIILPQTKILIVNMNL